MKSNALFPIPDISLEEVQAALDKLEAASLAAKDGGRTAISAMHDAEETADNIFRILAAYVNRIADGDKTTILGSGFHTSKQPVSIQKPELSASVGDNSGSIWLVVCAVDKAGAYIWQYSKDTVPTKDEEWIVAAHSTQSYFQITGLTVASKNIIFG